TPDAPDGPSPNQVVLYDAREYFSPRMLVVSGTGLMSTACAKAPPLQSTAQRPILSEDKVFIVDKRLVGISITGIGVERCDPFPDQLNAFFLYEFAAEFRHTAARLHRFQSRQEYRPVRITRDDVV